MRCAPHRISADLDILRTAHTGFADLNTAIRFGSTSLNPPENGAGEFPGPKKCQHFPGKNGASWKKIKNRIALKKMKNW